jgi:hypothetical protein
MTSDSTLPESVSLRIDADPAIWLYGPLDESDIEDWVRETAQAVLTDFKLSKRDRYGDFLRDVLRVFARGELGSQYRLLRHRFRGDEFVIARVDVLFLSEEEQAELIPVLSRTPSDAVEPVMIEPVMIDGAAVRPGLTRYLNWIRNDDNELVGNLRYHRHIDALGVDIMVRSNGDNPGKTLEALEDLDRLANAVWLTDEQGRSW